MTDIPEGKGTVCAPTDVYDGGLCETGMVLERHGS